MHPASIAFYRFFLGFYIDEDRIILGFRRVLDVPSTWKNPKGLILGFKMFFGGYM